MLFKNEVVAVVELLLSFSAVFSITAVEKFNEFDIVSEVCGVVKLLVELFIFVGLLVKEDETRLDLVV